MAALSMVLTRGWKRLDPAWSALVVIPLILGWAAPEQLWVTLSFVADSLAGTAPFLAVSVLVAAYAKASGAEALIARAFHGRAGVMVVSAALVGAASPFCSCGVIPLIAALLSMGVPLAPVMAFWLSSPIMDPSMFVLTVGTLGVGFAVAKTVAAVGLGLLGGGAVLMLGKSGFLADPLRSGVGNGGCGGATVRAPQAIVWTFWRMSGRRAQFAASAHTNGLFLLKWLTLAFLLESLMLAWVPAELIIKSVGGEGLLPIAIATMVGVPAYLNGYAALPLVGGLLEQGMSPGAGMAFLVAGGVTSIPAAIAVFALARRRVFALYVVLSLVGALLAGGLWSVVA